MKRGEIWTVSGGNDFAGKPRPALIVQDNLFGGLNSIAICLFTSDTTETLAVRPRVEPSQSNGLRTASQVMVDKITAVSKAKLGSRIGVLSLAEMIQVNRALIIFLGLGS